MGWFITIILDDNLAMIELFKLFRTGVAWIDDETGRASSLILGIWKFETNFTLVFRREINWHETTEA
mgnify:CR=1 FL=1